MKTKLAKKYTRTLFIIAALIAVSACKPASERLYVEAYAEIEKGHFRIAVDLLEKSSNLEKKNYLKFRYLAEAGRIARFEIQDYERAIRIYKNIILQSEDEAQRINAQEAISEIYLENLQNYAFALRELQVLEPLVKDAKEKEKVRLKIAQSMYLTGNNEQAIEQITTSLKSASSETMNFLKLKAQVLVAQQKYKDAIEAYQDIYKRDPSYFEKENMHIATSVVYEENEEYGEALDYLNKFEKQIKDKQYLDLRKRRLKERLVNKPLFKGKRK
ncbi:tetratricopeptide repeat protein [bacterium]|nr:tetratricopeptide repeat protein [bacterium]